MLLLTFCNGGVRGGGGFENHKTAQKYAKKPQIRIPKPHVHQGHNMKAAVSKTCKLI